MTASADDVFQLLDTAREDFVIIQNRCFSQANLNKGSPLFYGTLASRMSKACAAHYEDLSALSRQFAEEFLETAKNDYGYDDEGEAFLDSGRLFFSFNREYKRRVEELVERFRFRCRWIMILY